MSGYSKKLTKKHQNIRRFQASIDDLKQRLTSDLQHHNIHSDDQTILQKILVVSISEQNLYLLTKQEIDKNYLISTAAEGIGNQSGSFQTPLGIHRITEKIGANADFGSIFKGRKNTHKIATIFLGPNTHSKEDNITSRILRLEGLEDGYNKGMNEDGINVDSFSRYIYIHGTDEEGQLGKPASHGCVRMANQDIVELFDKVETGLFVLIQRD